MIRRFAVALALFALVACKPDCAQLAQLLEAAKASGNAAAIAAAQAAVNEAKCVPPVTPPPSLCADGLPPGADGCPTTCDDLACAYGCTQADPSKDAVCLPKPVEPPVLKCPATLCPQDRPLCKETEAGPVCYAEPVEPPSVPPAGEVQPQALLVDEGLTVKDGDMSARMASRVWAAVAAYKAALPGDWHVFNGIDAVESDPAKIDRAFEQISGHLAKVGVKAAQSIQHGGKRSDCIFVCRPGSQECEEWHLFNYGNGQVASSSNAMKGVYITNGAVTEPPPVTPPGPPVVEYGCPDPRPDRVWTVDTLPPGWGQDQIGQPRWKLDSKTHGAWIDTTATTVRNEPYCRAIGMSPDANGNGRGGCPMRSEGAPFAERVACERYVAEGDWVTVSDDGLPCESNPSNSAQFRARGGHCRLCNPARTVCTTSY